MTMLSVFRNIMFSMGNGDRNVPESRRDGTTGSAWVKKRKEQGPSGP